MSSTPETIAAGTWREWFEPGDFFRLLSTTAPVSVEFYSNGKKTVELQSIEAGYAEYFRGEDGKLPFDRVRIYSATTQTVQFVTRQGSDVRYDRGASSVTGTVALDAATLAALEQINVRSEAASGFFNSAAALAAGTAETVFTAGANTNGAIVLSAFTQIYEGGVTPHIGGFFAKATAPTTTSDAAAEPICVSHQITTGGTYIATGKTEQPQFIPAGKGLFYVDEVATPANDYTRRGCRYKLL
jgi:hypothetical protein